MSDTRPLLIDALPSWKELSALGAIVLLSLFVNIEFSIKGFGEQDSARLANDAILLQRTGTLDADFAQYRPRILPLSLVLTRTILDLGVEPVALPGIYNRMNAVFGALMLIPLYLIFRHFAGARACMGAVAMASFMPAFWIARIYGYPHALALFFFLVSLSFFLRFLLERQRKRSAFLIICAGLAISICTGIKADTMLSGGAFISAALIFGGPKRHNLLGVGALFVIAVASPLLIKTLWLNVSENDGGVISFATNWNETFPVSLLYLVSRENLSICVRAMGPVFAVAAMVSTVYLLRWPYGVRIVAFVLSWSVPVLLFWGVRGGNSARHMLFAVLPFALANAAFVIAVVKDVLTRTGVFLALIIANYFSLAPAESTVAPSTRLIASRDLIDAKARRLMMLGEGLETSKSSRIFLVGSWTTPYVLFSVLSSSADVTYDDERTLFPELTIIPVSGDEYVVAWDKVTSQQDAEKEARRMRELGYCVRSWEYTVPEGCPP